MFKYCRVAIVASVFHKQIVKSLVKNVVKSLYKQDLTQIKVVEVPGAFEIPLIAAKLARSQDWDALVCLGCVIRGETPHFDLICNEVSRALMSLSLETEKPIINGVLTVNSFEQAAVRAGLRREEDVSQKKLEEKKVVYNKGQEFAEAALAMLRLLKGSEF